MLISIWTKKNIYIFFEQSHISCKISTRNWNTRFIAMIGRLYIWKIFHLESFHHPDSATRKNVCFSVEISGGRNGWGRNGGNNVAESVSLVLWSTECNGTSIQLQRREKSLVLHALVSSPPPPPPLLPPRPPPLVPHSFVSSSYPWSWTLLSVKPNPHHWITVYRTVYDVIELSVTSRHWFSTLFWE